MYGRPRRVKIVSNQSFRPTFGFCYGNIRDEFAHGSSRPSVKGQHHLARAESVPEQRPQPYLGRWGCKLNGWVSGDAFTNANRPTWDDDKTNNDPLHPLDVSSSAPPQPRPPETNPARRRRATLIEHEPKTSRNPRHITSPSLDWTIEPAASQVQVRSTSPKKTIPLYVHLSLPPTSPLSPLPPP